jgi:hypothetical protein
MRCMVDVKQGKSLFTLIREHNFEQVHQQITLSTSFSSESKQPTPSYRCVSTARRRRSRQVRQVQYIALLSTRIIPSYKSFTRSHIFPRQSLQIVVVAWAKERNASLILERQIERRKLLTSLTSSELFCLSFLERVLEKLK